MPLQAYCSRKGVEPETYRYVYDREYINPEAWPSLLEMEDNDSIDSFIAGGQLEQCSLKLIGTRLNKTAKLQQICVGSISVEVLADVVIFGGGTVLWQTMPLPGNHACSSRLMTRASITVMSVVDVQR